MQCANPRCSKELLYLRDGRLELLELESHSHDRVAAEDGFPVKSSPSRFFWLCGECAKTHRIKRWTPSGLVLEAAPCRTSTVSRTMWFRQWYSAPERVILPSLMLHV
jgi:hypothetical protein